MYVQAIGFVLWGFGLIYMGFGEVFLEPIPFGVTIVFAGKF